MAFNTVTEKDIRKVTPCRTGILPKQAIGPRNKLQISIFKFSEYISICRICKTKERVTEAGFFETTNGIMKPPSGITVMHNVAARTAILAVS